MSIFPLTAYLSAPAASHGRMPVKPTLAAHMLHALRTSGLLLGAASEGVKTRAGQVLVLGRLLLEFCRLATLLLLGGWGGGSGR